MWLLKRSPREMRDLKSKHCFRKIAERRGLSSGQRVGKIYRGDLYTACFRGLIALFGVALQISVMLLLSLLVLRYTLLLYFILEIVGIFFGLYLVYDGELYRFFWLVLILVLPVIGLFFYFVWGSRFVNRTSRKRLMRSLALSKERLPDGEASFLSFEREKHNQIACARYLKREGLPVYQNTSVRYYAVGDAMKDDLLKDLSAAKKRIWLQYFIIFGGRVWDSIEEILAKKAKAGVDVRLLIDDVGCMRMINRSFRHRMKEKGIRLNVFSPIHRDVTKLAMNYRNHQKILVVDNDIAYTGGINLSDEYFNLYPRYGHWKDSAVRLYGEGAQTLAGIFVAMWNYTTDKRIERISFSEALSLQTTPQEGNGGYLQPFYCGPLKRRHNNADMVYQSVISHARDRVRISTPYLILDRSMRETLCRVARSGVDVRIYTPRCYDKWYVHRVTEENYGRLLSEGVRIFEYLPGFIHAKNLLADEDCAICGSINLDYRSFYFHYEDAVIFYGGNTVSEIDADFCETEKKCEEITLEMWRMRPWYRKALSWILKFCSPLF